MSTRSSMLSPGNGEYAILILALALAATVVAIVLRRARKTQQLPNSYAMAKPLSEPEQTLYWRLKEALPECVVLSQVAFSRFMSPKHEEPGARLTLFRRISQKSVDFLVCLPDFTVVCALELDDRTHDQVKDARRDALLQSAGIPVVRVDVRDLPSVEELRAIFTR